MRDKWRTAYMLARVSGPKMGHRPADFARFASAIGVSPVLANRALFAVQDRRACDVLSVRIQIRRKWKYRGPVTIASWLAETNRNRFFGVLDNG